MSKTNPLSSIICKVSAALTTVLAIALAILGSYWTAWFMFCIAALELLLGLSYAQTEHWSIQAKRAYRLCENAEQRIKEMLADQNSACNELIKVRGVLVDAIIERDNLNEKIKQLNEQIEQLKTKTK